MHLSYKLRGKVFLYLEMHDKHSINIANLVNERKLNSLKTNFKFLKSYAPEKILSYFFLKIGIEKKNMYMLTNSNWSSISELLFNFLPVAMEPTQESEGSVAIS